MDVDADLDLNRLDEIPDVWAQPPAQEIPPPPRFALEEAGPVRGVVRRRRAFALLGGFAWLAAQVGVLGLRTDFDQLGTVFSLIQVALPAALGAVSLAVFLWPGRDGLGARPATLRAVTMLVLVALTAVTFVYPAPFKYVAPPGLPPPLAWMLVCADIVFVMGVIPLAAAAAAWRRGFAVAAAERTAALGAAAGFGAITSMHLHCQNILPEHVLFGHIVPAAALALLGGLVLHRLTRA